MVEPIATADMLHQVRFPNEGPDYRMARDALLCAEIDLRRQIERVAALRRELPPGGEITQNYEFDSDDGPVKLSELFGDKDTLIVYSFMYGPKMERPCPACTSILDGLDGEAPHVNQRASLVVVARSPMARIRNFASERGWSRLRLLSSGGNDYQHDYHAEAADGSQMPALNLFIRRDGTIRHFWSAELLYAPEDPGQHARHVDSIWPLWNLLDLTPEGRGAATHPKLSYG
jgi:predicted dithiol-disulfide oxidoreductase (DUF899 family)